MDLVLLIVSAVLALPALFLVGDFLLWRARGHVVRATITGFQEKKSRFILLPDLSFTMIDGKKAIGGAQRIDRFTHWLNRPREGDLTTIIYKGDEAPEIRIYGYMNVVAGALLMFPLAFMLVSLYADPQIVAQMSYIFMFGAILLGGWLLLKLIQRNY